MSMGLQNGGTCAHDFPTFASGVAGSTERTQPTLRCGPIRRLRQGALAGCFSCPIYIEDEPVASLAIPQPCHLLLFVRRTAEPILKKKPHQAFARLRVH